MSIPGKNLGNCRMVHFKEIIQAPFPYSMLQYIGKLATSKLVPKNCVRYFQARLFSEFMWAIVG